MDLPRQARDKLLSRHRNRKQQKGQLFSGTRPHPVAGVSVLAARSSSGAVIPRTLSSICCPVYCNATNRATSERGDHLNNSALRTGRPPTLNHKHSPMIRTNKRTKEEKQV
eukprot:COSAG06_NODE_1004_length_11128_cov_5.572944_1_plen_111_part_00